MTRVGFLGTGHIAAPMARTLARKGHDVHVSERNADTAAALAEAFENIAVAPNQSVLDESEVVFLCLRPHRAKEVLGELKLASEHRIVSVMAGIGLETLRTLCAPASEISMTIPLGYLEAGGCPLAVYPDDRTLAPLFGEENPVLTVATERGLNTHFAICALVPGVLDLMSTASDWLGERTGDTRSAALYTQQLVAGFLAATRTDRPDRLALERDALATEGTLSLQMTTALRDAGAHQALTRALDAIATGLEPGT